MYLFANTTIYVGLALAIYSLLIITLGISTKNQKLINSGKGGVIAILVCASMAMLSLFYLLATSQFQYEYVSDYTSSELPIIYKLTALWAGNSGSLLLWTFFLVLYTVMIAFSRKMKGNPMVPYISAILLGNIVFFFLVLGFVAKPFVLLDQVPIEGHGLNPMLQNPGMIIHPVTLYLGYVGLAIPFAFAMAALILKNVDDFWIKMTRRWTIIAWLFLSLGNIFGGQWAYTELGWGGYWAWDPVENASFMPWLTATAFLHSVMIQERKNMLKIWNIGLIITSYALTLFGTFLVRSGVLTSVHAFANSNLGLYFLIFMGVAVIGALYVLMSRYNLLKRSAGEFNSYISKESSFLINNLLLVGAAFGVFWGTVFPLVSEAVRGTKVTVGMPFFNTVQAPILLSMMFVMAVCPLLAWQKSS
jgi:cytochrome c-type biogenesis protein CcmF